MTPEGLGSHAEIENLLWLLCLGQGAKGKVALSVGLVLSKQKIGMVWHHRRAAGPSFGARFYTEEVIAVEGLDFLIHLVAEHWLGFQQG